MRFQSIRLEYRKCQVESISIASELTTRQAEDLYNFVVTSTDKVFPTDLGECIEGVTAFHF